MSNNTANLGNLSVRIAVSYRDPKSLQPYPGNPRTHSKAQVRKIARNIEQFGFLVPLLVDRKDVVIAGHARLVAALRLQLPEVPVVRIDHLTPTEVRALRLADNRLAEEADWDHIRLREEFEALVIDPVEIDLTLTGFEVAEIDRILVVGEMDEEEPVLTRKPAVTRLGDLWILGEHRVLCGSALRQEDYDILTVAAKETETEVETTRTGSRYATSVQGTLGVCLPKDAPPFATSPITITIHDHRLRCGMPIKIVVENTDSPPEPDRRLVHEVLRAIR